MISKGEQRRSETAVYQEFWLLVVGGPVLPQDELQFPRDDEGEVTARFVKAAKILKRLEGFKHCI